MGVEGSNFEFVGEAGHEVGHFKRVGEASEDFRVSLLVIGFHEEGKSGDGVASIVTGVDP